MKVKILSGTQAGTIADMSDAEGLQNIESGFAEAIPPEVPVAAISSAKVPGAVSVPVTKVKAAKAPKLAKKGTRGKA